MTILVAIGFASVGLLGLLAAKRPETFGRYFLAEWQRERLAGNVKAASWTGWVIFGFCIFSAAMILLEAAFNS